ncbi:MAG: 3-oxoacyl-[acyl-carrier protein] reductase, partial [Pseudonocardiales bacterium]|nr:3-oxoacyl-[acyl-carrier protein] reductase [Pseudonocardiales bacterium]
MTGGSRGLGFAAAQALVSEGAQVVLSSRNEASVAAAATRLAESSTAAGNAAWIAADNGEPAAAARLVEAAQDRFGRLDGALVSVGGTPSGTGLDT